MKFFWLFALERQLQLIPPTNRKPLHPLNNPPLMKSIRTLISVIVVLTSFEVSAQLDTKHWVPPYFAKPGPETGNNSIEDHFVALSTPFEETIPVTITNGYGELIGIVEISRDRPAEYLLGTGNANPSAFPLNVIPEDSLNMPIRSQGLYFESFQPFFVNMRHKCGSQGTSLTTKGQAALGRRFYSGHLYTTYADANIWNPEGRSHFISVMATEDGTTVTFDMIKEPINLIGYEAGEPVTVVLNALESFVVGVDHQFFDNETINLTNGIRITSDRDIVCNSGSWLAGADVGRDIGSDQLVPAENTGMEYILIRGLGDESTERPMVVATKDNTLVFLNSETEPADTLDEGEFFVIPTSAFTDNGNLYVSTTEKSFMYQTLSGSDDTTGHAVGLSFIPPLNCVGAKVVNIPFVSSLAAGPDNGRINIITKSGGDVFLNGSGTPLDNPLPVEGNSDWVTYAFTPTTNNVLLESDSVMNVALLTRDDEVGTAGYFSGFTLEPVVGLSTSHPGSLPCTPGNASLQVFGFDAYQWYFEGDAIEGATGPSHNPEFSGEYVVEGIDFACGHRFPSNPFQIPFCPSTIGAAKNEEAVTETAPGSRIFDVDYRITIENFLPTIASNIQVIENIEVGLPNGATAELIEGPVLASGDLESDFNPGFNGTSARNLLSGEGTMPGSSSAAIEFTVRVDMNNASQDGYFNQVTVTTTEEGPNDGVNGPFNGQDFSHEGIDADPNNSGEPNEEGANDFTRTCFFSNEFFYDESAYCNTVEDSVSVALEGIFSGTFTAAPAGLTLDSLTGAVVPASSAPGEYTVTYTTTGRCPKETTTEVVILGLPDNGETPAAAELCADEGTVELLDFLNSASQGGIWTDTEGGEVPADFDTENPGSYTFTYVLDLPPCEMQSQVLNLTVVPEPNPGIATAQPEVCFGEGEIALSEFLSGQDTDGVWTDGEGNSVDENFIMNDPGIFQLTYEVENEGCGSRSVSFELNVAALPDAGLAMDVPDECIGAEVEITDYLVGGSSDGTWIDQTGSEIESTLVTLNNAGTFAYYYVVSSEPCPADSAAVTINATVGPDPGTTVGAVNMCVSDPPINLNTLLEGADEGGKWTDAEGEDVTAIFLPEVFGPTLLTYSVSSEECGEVSTTVTINVTELDCIDPALVIPQGYSPNGDGVGDFWVIEGLQNYPDHVLKVFNRWGSEVFSARPYNNEWGGTAQSGINMGSQLPVGTYFYVLDLRNGSEPRKGYIFLQR